MNQFRIGLIGLGGMAQEHIRWMNAENVYQFVAVSDVNGEAVVRVGDQLGIEDGKRYADFKDLIEDPDVDAVISVTPNNVHADIIRACLQAGKPFWRKNHLRGCSKRQSLAGAIRETAGSGHDRLYVPLHAGFRYARELVRTGKLRTIRHFSIQYLQGFGVPSQQVPYMWRYNKAVTGTGTLGDLGSHMIDMARFLFGEFEEITAQLHTIIPERRDPVSGAMAKIEVDDFASFQARMIDGMMGVFRRRAMPSVQAISMKYPFTATTARSTPAHWIRNGWYGFVKKSPAARQNDNGVPQHCKVKQYADFAGLLRGTPADGIPGFMDGYRNQEVLDAVVRAHETKAVVELRNHGQRIQSKS